ncbi:PREDICTED: UBX domain-containing protein 2A [Propithecus coquereli]|uniref:UBX domain-containing protein 2A n=1 Tax=Propithecus coquereli TaxID=379532 RepID=UPI00063EE160|nr:PREDICTED: UBX domain-containing protein 2A [Propithecus coquereli]
MKEVDNLESIKEEWACETGSDNQPLSDNQQTNCEYFVDSLFEEAQKVGAKCLSTTEQKKQVNICLDILSNSFCIQNMFFRERKNSGSFIILFLCLLRELPSELQGIFNKEEVDVKVEDKKNEVCVSTKPVFQPFSGQGHRLGRVSHIKDFIEQYQGSQRSPPFSLATALPFLKLLDETLTLEEADLQNAVIIQRLQKTAEPFIKLSEH